MSRQDRVLAFAFLTVFLDLAGFGIIIPLLPFYVRSMGGTAETVGLLLSSFSLTQLLATPLLGRFSDRVGRRPVILVSLLGNALAMLLFALATKLSLLPLLFCSRILAGATSGNIAACQAAIADVTAPEERAKGMGRLGAGIGLGMVLGPVLGSTVSRFGAWAPPLSAAVLAALDLAGAFFLMPETKAKAGPARGPSAPRPRWSAELAGSRGILVVLALYFLTFIYLSTINVALPLITALRLGWTEHEIGHVFGLFGLVMLVVQGGLIGAMTRAWGARLLVAVGSALAAIGLFGIATAQSTGPLMGALACLAFGVGVVNPCLSAIASEQAGAERQGTVLGFAQSAGSLARTLGPTAAGFLYVRLAPPAPFLGGAGAALVSTALAVSLVAASRKAES